MLERATDMPSLAPQMAALLGREPQRGVDLVREAQAFSEDVFHALAWLEARGYAELRPIQPGVYGWAEGREALA